MGSVRAVLGGIATLLALALPALGCAQEPAPVARGEAALRSGDYPAATRLLESAAGSGPVAARIRAARLLAVAYTETGQYEDALAALDRLGRELPGPELATARGRVLREIGREDEAGAAFDEAVAGGASDALTARLERAELLWWRGEREGAYEAFDGFIDAYNEGRATTAADLTAVGTAVRYLGRRDPDLFHDAVRAYEEAIEADPAAFEPRLRMADLFLDKYDGAEAQSLYGAVLATNPKHPRALVGMARAKRFEGSADAMELVERALETNPASASARALSALLQLELGETAVALEEADRALESDPRSRQAMAVRAAVWFLRDDRGEYQAALERARSLDPTLAGFHTTIAELAVRRARYREAVEQAAAAVAVDSTAWDGWSLLGMNQLRLGRVEEARQSLERAFAGDPFNVWTKNSLDLLDRLAEFETVRTERFELVLHRDEAELLAPYVGEVAEEAYETLARRYGYSPEVPVRLEVFPRHADFSVRTMGLTGLGALGVAFGNVLAMDSPAARDEGTFHWGSTLWHEIAHAVTLGLTDHRIPRWLTEGISVREERRSRPGWGGDPGLDFLVAFAADRLLPMERIDEGFVRPTWPAQVLVSYQHGSLAVELIERDHGPEAVRELMEAFAEGRTTAQAFQRVLDTDPAAFDDALRSYVRERYADGLRAVASLDRASGDESGAPRPPRPTEPDAAVREARSRPDDFGAQLVAGTSLFRAGRHDDAVPFLERAKSLYPGYVASGSPYALLAEIHLERGDPAAAAAELEGLTARSETAYEANLELATVLDDLGDHEGAAAALERAIYIYPYNPDIHDRLATLAERLDRPQLEVRERRALVALGPVDRAGALYRLALAQRRAGEVAAARRSVMQALEVAPGYPEAQELLLDLSGSDR